MHSFCRCVACSCAVSFNFVMQKNSFPSYVWLCSCSREITINQDYQTLSSLYINEKMKQYWSLRSQCVIVSQIDYLPQLLASQISVPSDQIYWCFTYSLMTSDNIHQSPSSKTPINVDTPSCTALWRNLCLCIKCGELNRVSVTSRFRTKPWFFKVSPDDLFCKLQCRRLIRPS